MLKYLLITAARNEEAFIKLTIESVINQTVLPVRWIIVSDGSTDRTDEIVRGYAATHNWIELYRMPERSSRDFGGKARCFNTAFDRAKGA
jgi:biofilm PGA synthesis N-glycosyltransferase PgaC